MWNHALVLCVHLFPSCEAVRLKIKKWMTACSMLQYLIILSLIRLWMNVYLIFVEIQQFNWGTCKIFILLRCSFSQTAELIITKKTLLLCILFSACLFYFWQRSLRYLSAMKKPLFWLGVLQVLFQQHLASNHYRIKPAMHWSLFFVLILFWLKNVP